MTATESLSGNLCSAEHSSPPRHSPSLCPVRGAQHSLLRSRKKCTNAFLGEQKTGSYISFYRKPVCLYLATKKWHAVIKKEGLVLFLSVSTEMVSFYMFAKILFISLGGVSQRAWLTQSSFGFTLRSARNVQGSVGNLSLVQLDWYHHCINNLWKDHCLQTQSSHESELRHAVL